MSARRQTRTRAGRDEARTRRVAMRRPDRPWYVQVSLFFAIVAAVIVAVVFAEVASSYGKIHPRVSVAGVRVGGLTPARAEARLSAALGPRVGTPVTLTHGEKRWTLKPERVDARLDATGTVARAYALGRTGTFAGDVRARARIWLMGSSVSASVDTDGTRLRSFVAAVARSLDVTPTDAAVTVKGTDVEVTPPSEGKRVPRDDLRASIERALLAPGPRRVEVPLVTVGVAITEEGAEQARADAERMLAGPVLVTYGAERWRFTPEQIAEWVTFRTEDTTGGAVLVADLDAEEVSSTAGPRVARVGRQPKDARFITGSGKVTIAPSQDGLAPDMERLAANLRRVLTSDATRTVQLSTRRKAPALTTAKAQGMGIRERISTYSTDYDAGNKPRVNNIHLLAKSLDGALVAPGATFSFNGQIGERTAEKGYQEAPAIVQGKLVPQLGGGICQVGTTIFNTVFFSGLPVVERHNHSFYISHYPKGRDATVSWGGPDFKFRNDTGAWLLIKTAVGPGSLTVSLYGTDPGYDVAYTTGPFTDPKPHGVKQVEDPLVPAGARILQDSGVDGRRVVVKRTVTKAGKVVRTDTFRSVYSPKEEVVRVGVKARSGEATQTP